MGVLHPDVVEWLRSRPEPVKEMLRRFPPRCRVHAVALLRVPGPGVFGEVVSYFEPAAGAVGGCLGVLAFDGQVVGMCRPEQLEVVGYYRDLTPEQVGEALS